MPFGRIYRFRLTVKNPMGLNDWPCILIDRLINLYFPGIPVSVLYQGEEQILRQIIDLFGLAIGSEITLEFRMKASAEHTAQFKKCLLLLSSVLPRELLTEHSEAGVLALIERLGQYPLQQGHRIFENAYIADQTQHFNSALNSINEEASPQKETERRRKFELLRLHAKHLSQIIPELSLDGIFFDHEGWRRAEEWLAMVFHLTESATAKQIVGLGVIHCVFGALEALEAVVLETLENTPIPHLFLCDYVLARTPFAWEFRPIDDARQEMEEMLEHSPYEEAIDYATGRNALWHFYRRLPLAREYVALYPEALDWGDWSASFDEGTCTFATWGLLAIQILLRAMLTQNINVNVGWARPKDTTKEAFPDEQSADRILREIQDWGGEV